MLAVVIAPDGIARIARVEVVSDSPEGAADARDEGAHRRRRRGDPRGAGRRRMRPLAGRTVLVTRPADQSVELVRRLRAPGSRARSSRPTIEIVPVAIRGAHARAARPVARAGSRGSTLTSRATRRDAGVAAGVPGRRPREGGGDRRRDGQGVPRGGRGGAPTSCRRRSPRRVWRGRSRAATGGCSARGPTSPPPGWRMRSRRRAGPRSASTPTAPGWRGRFPRTRGRRSATERSTPSRSPARRRCAGSSERLGRWSAATPKVVSIGPVTAREARAHGLRVSAVARPHTIEGLVAALERGSWARRRGILGRIRAHELPPAAAPTDAAHAGAPSADPRDGARSLGS